MKRGLLALPIYGFILLVAGCDADEPDRYPDVVRELNDLAADTHLDEQGQTRARELCAIALPKEEERRRKAIETGGSYVPPIGMVLCEKSNE